jgi:DNA helicase II / ATP-dependent DNA helicase PcrA
MTFSRRAASEMARRVERISARVLKDKSHVLTEALTWAGTFHGIGARILREHAEDIGLDPQFTIHDREDSAKLGKPPLLQPKRSHNDHSNSNRATF